MEPQNPPPLSLQERTENLENRWHQVIYTFAHRLLRSFFQFKKRKGEFSAATVTFYTLMSFTPLMLFTLSAYGWFIGDEQVAFVHIFKTLKNNFPHLAPWILKSLKKIVAAKINHEIDFSIGGSLLLLYGCIGFTSSLNYGLYHMASTEPKGGKLFEDLRSLASASLAGIFVLSFIYLTMGFQSLLGDAPSVFKKVAHWGFERDIWQALGALAFFSLYYKWLTPINVRFNDAFIGGLSFVLLFFLGKSFYWVYLKMAQQDMINNFGDFYTLTEAVIWIYYLSCSFFYSATVAYDQVKKRDGPSLREKLDQSFSKAS